MVEEILKMYFEEHMKQKDIAEFFKVSSEYVSKVVRNDDRYPEEKQRRHQEAKLRKAKYNKEYLETYERKKDKSDKEDYEKLQALLDSDASQMSRHSFGISTDAFVKSKINFLDISKVTEKVLSKDFTLTPNDFNDVFEIDNMARSYAKEFL